MFAGGIRTADVSQSITTMQSGARYALDTMAVDMRSAGFRGCAAPESSALNISIANAAAGLFTTDVIRGALVTSAGWLPDEPAGYVAPVATAAGAPINGTHALIVQYGMAPGTALSASMTSTSSDLVLSGQESELSVGSYALISDCNGADIFEVSSLAGTAAAQEISPTMALGRRYLVSADYPQSVRVMPLVGAIYYVGDTGRQNSVGDSIHALYLQSLPFDPANNPPTELIEGVDQMLLRFGVINNDGTIQHVPPQSLAVTAMNTVDVVTIALLMASIDSVADDVSAREYQLAGQTVGPRLASTATNAAAYTPDRRMRIPFNKTIKLRNRNL